MENKYMVEFYFRFMIKVSFVGYSYFRFIDSIKSKLPVFNEFTPWPIT